MSTTTLIKEASPKSNWFASYKLPNMATSKLKIQFQSIEDLANFLSFKIALGANFGSLLD
jgi:hypothetical protein